MTNDKKIFLVGLDYVGSPLEIAFAEKFQIVSFDMRATYIQELEDEYVEC
jgi:UDP-N-acetyl-D-glucosamine/UDP-N-acetyl-D-galactosamine dehydrogenase